MKRLIFYFFLMMLGNVVLQAQNCTELFPGKNLHPDWQMTSVAMGLDTGWGSPKTLISAAEEPEHVYCGESSVAVGELTGGGCQASLDIPVEFKPNTSYRVRAMVYVDTKKFKIGVVNIGDLVISTKNQEWEQLDHCFETGPGDYTTMYFNSCEGYNGNIGYIDNWEVYEWPSLTLINQLTTLCEKGNSLYDSEKAGAQALRDAITAGETLLTTISADNVAATNLALETAIENVMMAMATYLEPLVSSSMDYTFAIKNPTFETSLYGWESTTGASNNQRQTNATQSNPDGTGKFWENWNSESFSGQMFQVIYGIPNGNYTLKMAAFRNNNSEDVFMYANADNMVQITSSTLKYHTINCAVTDNSLEIGLYIKEATTNWVGIDNVTLTYRGSSMNALNGLITEAEGNYAKPMEAAVAMELAAAIAQAKTAVSEAEIAAAITLLSAANDAAIESIALYEPLKEKLDAANADKSKYASYSGYADFIVILDAIEQDYTAGAYSADDIQDAINNLRAAEIACRITNPSTPADFTFTIWNPSFEEGQEESLLSEGGMYRIPYFWQADSDGGLDGWIDIKVIDTTGGDMSHDGNHLYNVWAGTVNYFSLYQSVDLPKGDYTLTAAMRTQSTDHAISQYIYAEIDGVKYPSETLVFYPEFDWKSLEAWNLLSVDFDLEETATVVIGAESNGGWFQLDDFRLTRKSGGLGTKAINKDQSISAIGVANGILVKSDAARKINVYSVLGQLIRNKEIAAGETFIPVAAGIYLVNGVKVLVK